MNRISVPKQLRTAETEHLFSLSIASRIQTIKTYMGSNSISYGGVATMKSTKENDTELCVIAFKELINEIVSSLSREEAINYITSPPKLKSSIQTGEIPGNKEIH